MQNKRSPVYPVYPVYPLLLAISASIIAMAPTPAAALECQPRSFGGPLNEAPPPQWFDLIDYLDATRRENRLERVRLKVFDTGLYGNQYPEQFRDREELLPEDWSELALRLEEIRGDRPTDVRMEVYDASPGRSREPFLIVNGGPALSTAITDGRKNPIFYRLRAVGTDLSEIVGCY